MRARKVFAGRKIRAIRQQNGLTQAAFAEQLGISTSYLNQLENNQRHITAPVLLALAEVFSIDIKDLSGNDDDRLLADLSEAFADPVFGGQVPPAADLKQTVQNTPSVAHAFLSMHQALRRAGERLAELDDTLERTGAQHDPTPYEEVRDFFHYIDNYVDELDRKAESLAGEIASDGFGQFQALKMHIEKNHGIRVVMGGAAAETGVLRRYDETGRVLALNPGSPEATHTFQIAHQLALIAHSGAIDAIVEKAGFRATGTAAVCRIGLANYFAGAAMLPYGAFMKAARRVRHDLTLLAEVFGASVEQVAHRLSTLQRPGNKGLPFFFARVDQAGNITKRHSATKLQFARFGSACPLWNVHRAFETPNRIIRQLAETPDGVRYLCLATTVTKPSGGFRDPVQRHALALGCEVRHATELVYADDLDIARGDAFEPIGISCRICERKNCHQRAVPPLKRTLFVDEKARDTVPFSFE